MIRIRHRLVTCLAVSVAMAGVWAGSAAASSAGSSDWPQWGRNSEHQNVAGVAGRPIDSIISDFVYDPFTVQEQADFGGDLNVHYQVPLVRGSDVWMEVKSGTYTPLAPDQSNAATHWNTQIWNERRLTLSGGKLVTRWNFQSDWKPVPQPYAGWEPVFHPALAGDEMFVPGAGGTVFEVGAASGRVVRRVNPFGTAIDPATYVAGPLTVAPNGDIYYDALRLNSDLSTADSWLVRIDRRGRTSKISYVDLVPHAPTSCIGTFSLTQLPLPPSPDAVPASGPCGIQRAGLNIAPAIAPDGTVYTVSRADFNGRYSYLIAAGPTLKPIWAASLRDRLNDGCGVLLGIAPDDKPHQNSCRAGTHVGVEPATNLRPAGEVNDLSSSSPTVAPDGSILYGAYTRFNGTRGHLFKFSARGRFQASYDFGWDSTPAAFIGSDHREHIIIKDNHYPQTFCPPVASIPLSLIICAPPNPDGGPFYLVQLDSNLVPEWKYQNTNTQTCRRDPDGSVHCVSDHPTGFEWCVNAPVVDKNGIVYGNSEDGRLYAIGQGHHGVFTTPKQQLFLNLAIGAAYTPLSLLPNGRIMAQNNGHLFVVS